MNNPLLQEWNTPFSFPPFSKIKDTHFLQAFEQTLSEANLNYDRICENLEPPSFKNTIAEMERADKNLNRVASVFFNLAGSDSNPTRQEIQTELSPKLANFSSKILTNEKLWSRVRSVFESTKNSNLSFEQVEVVKLYHRMFKRAGAELGPKDKSKLSKISSRLATLGTKFSQNLLEDESSWSLPLEKEDLTGLPDFLVSALTQAATDRDLKGYLLTLSRSSVTPFLQFSSNRDLRETVYEAWASRGANGGKTDNRAIAEETLKLRSEKAQLLGYKSFADFKLENQMAKSPERVRELLMAVWEPGRARAEKDAQELHALMVEDGFNETLKAWDWQFYAEKRRVIKHSLNEAEIKPYFQLENIIQAAFHCASRLFNLNFQSVKLEMYHPDARAWEVSKNGVHLALFVGDYFARSSKRSGAWCSSLRGQSKFDGTEHPIAVNVCNFTKPKPGKPCLLSFDDASTLFHEFGHALHVMLSNVTYPSVSCTSVARDFVELPSQLFEHWLEVPAILNKFAIHSETQEPMPTPLINRLLSARNSDQGFGTVEYIASALVDLSFHEQTIVRNPIEKQAEVLKEIEMPEAIRMRHATPQFAHVFSGDGYASGYYSYMWSEVMDADAYKAFEEADDPFDPKTADLLHDCIYSTGGSSPPEELYIKFRGSLPGVEAIIKQRGFSD